MICWPRAARRGRPRGWWPNWAARWGFSVASSRATCCQDANGSAPTRSAPCCPTDKPPPHSTAHAPSAISPARLMAHRVIPKRGRFAMPEPVQEALHAIEAYTGTEKGYRRAHPRGLVFHATFTPTAEARALTTAEHFQGGPIHTLVRLPQ